MANKVLAFLEKAGKETEVVAVDLVTGTADAVRILTSAQTLSPAFKTGIQELIADAEAISTAAVAAGASSGVNLLSDAAVATATEKLVADFLKLLPTLKADASILAADVKV